MEGKRAIQMMAIALLTTFVIVFIFLSIKGMEFAELRLIEIIEFFIAIPLLTSVFYILLAQKFDEFNEGLRGILKQLEIEEEYLSGEELTLRREIAELRKIVDRMDNDVKALRKIRSKK